MANDKFLVKPGAKLRLTDHDPAWSGGTFAKTGGKLAKKNADELMEKNLLRLNDAQEVLYASNKYALLIVLQAMDAAGKDGVIKHVMSGVNPQGCQVLGFKQPSSEELQHNFLWRYSKCLPERGKIGIFNRSYYEEVLVVRVHPDLVERQRLARPKRGRDLWRERYEDINNLEKHLTRNNTVILKFFLNISKAEQKKRFLKRLDTPDKHWKFSPADLAERAHWKQYMEAYEDALNATSTAHAPWYIIPADHKWVARSVISEILADTIQSLDLKIPALTKDHQAALADAKKVLGKE